MSDTTADTRLADISLDRLIAETHKLVAESAKMNAEAAKLRAEEIKLNAETRRDRFLTPMQIAIAAFAGVGAALTAAGGIAGIKALAHAIGLT